MHKQNFDLKLELFHRREKQAALEDKIEQLASDKERLEAQNKELEADSARHAQAHAALVQEVDKRDKAVQEAVSMIVTLESEKDALTKDLNVLREFARNYLNAELDPSLASNTPRNESDDNLTPTSTGNKARSVSKMPSFVSQASQRTANLRDVWLGARASPMSSVRAVSGVSRVEAEPLAVMPSEVEHAQSNRLTSPSLSDLSESSFQSVYGQRCLEHSELGPDLDLGFNDAGDQQYLMGEDSARAAARVSEQDRSLRLLATPKPRIVTPTRLAQYRYEDQLGGDDGDDDNVPKQPAPARNNLFTSITDIIGPGSPMAATQRSFRASAGSNNSSSSSGTKTQHTPGSAVPPVARYASRPRDDKRDSLRRVIVDTRLSHDQGLPPTPDTISTTTLSGFKHSDDVLMAARAQQQSLVSRDAIGNGGVSLSPLHRGSIPTTPLITHDGTGRHLDGGSQASLPRRRPRSASETTVSRDWEESGDEDASSDAHSLESSLDIWLRESSKSATDRREPSSPFATPESLGIDEDLRVVTHPHPHYYEDHRLSASSAMTERTLLRQKSTSTGRQSNASGHYSQRAASGAWSAAGGSSSGSGAMAHDAATPLSPAGAIQAALFATLGGPDPPPPGRRSSLQAKTGGGRSPMTVSRPASTQPYRGTTSSSSSHAEFGMPSTVRPPPTPDTRKQYPPVSGPARGRLNLFRRSMSAAPTMSSVGNVPLSPASRAPSPGGANDSITAPTPTRALSSWGRRGSISEDDRATPPPIHRQRGNSISISTPNSSNTARDVAEGASLIGSIGSVSSGSVGSVSTISVSYKVPPPAETTRSRSPLHISTVLGRGAAGLSPVSAAAMQSPSQQQQQQQHYHHHVGAYLPLPPPPSASSKKKWLPFGRSNSLRTRAA
jgi:hypothetical protein